MLLDQAKTLTARISDYSRLKSNAGAARDFETRATLFGAAADAVQTAKSSLERMRQAGLAPDFTPQDSASLAAKAATLRDLLKQDPAKLNDPPFNLKYDFVDRIDGLCGAANKALLAAWQAHVAQHSDMVSFEIVTALSAIPQYKPVLTRISALKADVERLADAVPEDIPAGLARLSSIMNAYQAAWSEMIGDGIPKAVISFLRAAAAQNATIDQLTDEVKSWLKARSLLPLFRIKI